MPRINHFPKTVGVRLNDADGEKLQRLCAYTQRPPSELLRTLIRLAQPVDVAPVRFAATGDQERARG
jgi:hypothetical protein